MNTVRNGLIELKNILTTLKDDQRWYIYKIMNYSIQYVPDRWFEYCIAPYSYMVAGLPYGQHFGHHQPRLQKQGHTVAQQDRRRWQRP